MLSKEEQLEYLNLLEFQYKTKTEQYWIKGDLEFQLHEGQREVLSKLESLPKTKEVLIFCARQWGKSFFGLIYALRFAIKNPYSLVRIAAPTQKQASEIVSDAIDAISKDAPKDMIKRFRSEHKWFISGHSSIRVGSLEKAHVDSLRGARAHLIIAEEGGFVQSEDYEYAMRSVLAPQVLHTGGKIIHITTPSQDTEHYIHKEVLPRTSMTGTFFRYNIYTNPRLSEDQINESLTLLGGAASSAWRREALVEIVRDENFTCVPEFGPEYVKDFKLPEHSTYLTAIDFGGVRDKTVGLLMTYDFVNGIILVYDEAVFDSNTDTQKIVMGLRKMEGFFLPEDRVVDAAGQVLVDLRDKHDYQCLLPFKDSFDAGINNIRLLLKQGRLIIHSQCKFLIATLNGASFNKTRTDFNRTDFLGHCDALAALVYGCRMIDKSRNPYPLDVRNYDEKFYVTPEPAKNDAEKIANMLWPSTIEEKDFNF
jgi:hypothetical protein